MKKYTLAVGLLVFMSTLGGMAYGQGKDSSAGISGTGQSSEWNNQGSDQGMGSTSGSTGSSMMGMSSDQMQVDINTASAKELQGVPGISESIANNIVKYRDQNGSLTSVDELIKVKGINQEKLNTMGSHLTVGATGSQQQPMGGSQGGTSGMGPGSKGTPGTSDGINRTGPDMNSSGSGGTGY